MYSRNFWKDHITDAQGQIIQQGTPVNQTNQNKIEAGIFEAQVMQNLNAVIERLNQRDNRENAVLPIVLASATRGENSVVIPAGSIKNVTSYNVTPIVTTFSGAYAPVIRIGAKQANGFKIYVDGAEEFTALSLVCLVQACK